ncbi:Gfo/Idh/MocA family oxidoreductase [Sporomusa sp.]|uniref:Gfo/Idh/MocA family protein n=1 Tax=Sporomusa sp. TaxID=2078658 RepID=UPI002C9CF491|nr:Gfo/Idh/MocA family oxidoreductase [Sporomusa sp.]HWR45644.1 Gfo/Idh/MocA family oxidoreductase [Sporomusa sp.]
MKTIRWGMIGCGAVAEVKSGPGFYKADHSALVAVTGADLEQVRSYAARHHVPKVHESVDQLMQDDEIDIVYVATPPAFHKEYAIRCIQAGKPVYIEKPMAQTYEGCREIVEAARKAGVPAFVAYYRRAMDRFVNVKKLLDSKVIGELRFVNVMMAQQAAPEDYNRENLPWRLIPRIAGGGKFLDMAIHTMDILDFCCGPFAEVNGKASNQAGLYEVEDIVTANWKFANGVHGTGTWCFTSFENVDQVEFVGSQGKLWFDFFGQGPIQVKTGDGIVKYQYNDPPHVQQPFIQSIVNELLGIGECPGNLESAARASRVMDEILRGYRQEKGFDKLYQFN